MKSTVIFLLALLCFACGNEQTSSFKHEILLVDITDTTDKVTPADLNDYGESDREDGLCLSLVYITDVYNNPKETICIDSFSDGMTANVISRNHAIKDFNNEKSNLFSQLDSLRFGCAESQIFRAVCREMTYLSQKDDQSIRRLVVFSNLFENTKTFSVYRNSDIKRLAEPEELAAFLAGTYSIPDRLDGITLEIRYTPTLETEALHDQMIELYRHVFESRGCTLKTHVERITNIK